MGLKITVRLGKIRRKKGDEKSPILNHQEHPAVSVFAWARGMLCELLDPINPLYFS